MAPCAEDDEHSSGSGSGEGREGLNLTFCCDYSRRLIKSQLGLPITLTPLSSLAQLRPRKDLPVFICSLELIKQRMECF